MESKRIETFDDWKDTFQAWQKDINYDIKLFTSVLQAYEFSEKFADAKQAQIAFGEFGALKNGRIRATYHGLKSKTFC